MGKLNYGINTIEVKISKLDYVSKNTAQNKELRGKEIENMKGK
jgi:hypothetical protein